ncbi:MAG: hypothetical protein ABI318_08175 [Chthoniobacteraceae bacterium]
MVVTPSFSGEYAVRLHGAKGDRKIETAEKLFLTYSAADKNIADSMPLNRQLEKDKRQQKVKITEKTVEFPKPLATRVMQLFERMIQQTSYGVDEEGADGTTYEFGIWRAYGETWSPRENTSPQLFVELGESLISYCKAAPADRPAGEKEIENKAAQLEKYLNEHPAK